MEQQESLEIAGTISICYLYDPRDKDLVQQFEKHLSKLRNGRITWWSPNDINPGDNKDTAIEYHLANDQFILFFVSSDFLSSDLYQSVLKIAFQRHEAKKTRIIPILLRHVSLDVNDQLTQLQALPYNGNFVKGQRNKEEVFAGIVTELRELIKDEQESILSNMSSSSPPIFWNVPYRNFFFTGREKELSDLTIVLQSERGHIPQALSGPGGVGKTQIAIEYIYRYRSSYQAVFWVQSNTREELITSFVAIARLLNLATKDVSNMDTLVANVKQWLTLHDDWLLILDNIEDLELLYEFMPLEIKGHLLLTTPSQILGELALNIEIEPMMPEEGALLLLRCADLLARNTTFENLSTSKKTLALELFQELGGLPLALDQAGAYIQETQCGIADYLHEYRQWRARLLQRRGKLRKSHPESVTTTFLLSFERVKKSYPASANLLRLCAFLAPEAIPQELFTKDFEHLVQQSQEDVSVRGILDEIIVALRAYSLIRRDTGKKTLSVHRLAQAVLRDTMDEVTSQIWAEQAVKAVHRVFPSGEYETWSLCERYLTHALECAKLIKQYTLHLIEAAELLVCTAHYLNERGQYRETELLAQQALILQEERFGSEHLATSHCLSLLATSYDGQGRYNEAERLLQRVLEIDKNVLGPTNAAVATDLKNLAYLYRRQGFYEQAEPLYQEVLNIYEQTQGPLHPDTAVSLNKLATLYLDQGKYEQAAPLYKWALDIYMRTPDSLHPDVAENLHHLALVYSKQGEYKQAESLFKQSLVIWEQTLGTKHPQTIATLSSLASVYNDEGLYEQAASLYQQVLETREQILGPLHPDTMHSLNDLASLYTDQGQYEKAEQLQQRALAISEKILRPEHPTIAIISNNLARLYIEQGKYEQAEALLLRTIALEEKRSELEHPDLTTGLSNLANLYVEQGKYEQAQNLYRRVLTIREHALGSQHPETAHSLNSLAAFHYAQGEYGQAEQLWQQALAIRERTLGPRHPDTVGILNNLAALYLAQGKYKQAEDLLQQVLKIWEQALGPTHPHIAKGLINLASVYYQQEKYEQTEPLLQQALAIQEQQLGTHHPDIATGLSSLAVCYDEQGKHEQASPLHERALKIREQVLGPQHPDTATSLNNLAMSYADQKLYERAEPLCRRALTIREQVLSPQHPDIATSLNNLAMIYEKQEKNVEVTPLYERALSICTQALGQTHPRTFEILKNYISHLLTINHEDEMMQLVARFPMLFKIEKGALPYCLYIVEIRIDDDDDSLALFAYGENEQQARDNMQLAFSPEDWTRVEIISITPHPDGFQLSESIYLEGRLSEAFYQAYLPTIRKIRLPRIYDNEDTLDIFADILQRLINAGVVVEANIEIEEEEHIEEDEEGHEVVVEAGISEIWVMIEKEIKVDETGLFLIADEYLTIEDVDSAWFDLSYSPWKTQTKALCDLITELVDAGHFVQSRVNNKDVRILELEYRDGKAQAHYYLLDDGETEEKKESVKFYDTIDNLAGITFYVRYNGMGVLSRLYSPYFDENEEDDT